MGTVPRICEIVESTEELDKYCRMSDQSGNHSASGLRSISSIEDEINLLFQSAIIRISSRSSRDSLRRNASKRPMRAGYSPSPVIGITESLSLKQALRGLCISQASELAATKRLSKPANSSGAAEAATIKKLYSTVVVKPDLPCLPKSECKGEMLGTSVVPERITSEFFEKASNPQVGLAVFSSDQPAHPLPLPGEAKFAEANMNKLSYVDKNIPLSEDLRNEATVVHASTKDPTNQSHTSHVGEKIVDGDVTGSILVEVPTKLMAKKAKKVKFLCASSLFETSAENKARKSTRHAQHLMRPFFCKNLMKSKSANDSKSFSCCFNPSNMEGRDIMNPSTTNLDDQWVRGDQIKNSEDAAVASSSSNRRTSGSVSFIEAQTGDPDCRLTPGNSIRSAVVKADGRVRSPGGEDFSISSNSIGDCSSCTSISDTGNSCGSGRHFNRPPLSNAMRWAAFRSVQKEHGTVGLRHFKLMRKLVSGDIGTVYVAELMATNCLFALKIMNHELLVNRSAMVRAETEKKIMLMLNHPFLPTLFASFSTEKFSCLVMEYCPGGDLHVLRHKQPAKSFSEEATRFYVAEILLAMEYLHMLGVVYRDLRPANILVREDGHVMLANFDLSFICASKPMLMQSSLAHIETERKISSPCTGLGCVNPFCLHPSWQIPCFTPRHVSMAAKKRKIKSDPPAQLSPQPQLVAEPTSAKSNSFVGTREYLAPEIIKGKGHGNAVDWWMFGILLFELLYGKTPFKGSGNEDTLTNIVSQNLEFPATPAISSQAKDLISRLLIKDPENRLGSIKGAAEIKQHPFFEGINWALVRCLVPPVVPKFDDVPVTARSVASLKEEMAQCGTFPFIDEISGFEVF